MATLFHHLSHLALDDKPILKRQNFLQQTLVRFSQWLVVLTLLISCAIAQEVKKTPFELARAEYNELKNKPEYIEFKVPEDSPGPPFYVRIGVQGPDTLFLEFDQTVIIPMIRNVGCIDKKFNLLDLYHVPNAFYCPLNTTGGGLIEPNAPSDRFPVMSYLESLDMPVWFLESHALRDAIEDGILTLEELESLNPKKGIASSYIEYNKPRPENNYLLVIEGKGTIPSSNQTFTFSINEVNRKIESIHLEIK